MSAQTPTPTPTHATRPRPTTALAFKGLAHTPVPTPAQLSASASASASSSAPREAVAVVVVVGETSGFRRAAAAVGPREAGRRGVVDVGCSTGETTAILAKGKRRKGRSKRPRPHGDGDNDDADNADDEDQLEFERVVGVDISEDILEVARREHPGLDFRHIDAIADADKLEELVREIRAGTFFVDINGDRDMDTVLLVGDRILRDFAPDLLVIKSRKLHAELVRRRPLKPQPASRRGQAPPATAAATSTTDEEQEHEEWDPDAVFEFSIDGPDSVWASLVAEALSLIHI